MKISPAGLALIQHYEGCKLKAYPDPATGGKPWTIGWGDTGPDVVPGLVITQAEADSRLSRRLATDFEPAASAALTGGIMQHQFDAFVSALYNVGAGGKGRDGLIHLASGQPSTLLGKLNAGDAEGCADEFLKWNRAGGVVLLGLRRRRAAERALFLGSSIIQALAVGDAVK